MVFFPRRTKVKISPYYEFPSSISTKKTRISFRAERVMYLFPAGEKELVRVNPVGDCAPNDGEPVEDNGGFVGVLEQELAQDVDKDG